MFVFVLMVYPLALPPVAGISAAIGARIDSFYVQTRSPVFPAFEATARKPMLPQGGALLEHARARCVILAAFGGIS